MSLRAIFAVPLLILGTVLASAQSFDFKVANFSLLQDKPIQKELHVTEAQRATMNKFAKAYAVTLNGLQKQAQKTGGRPDANTQKQAQGALVTLRKNVLGVLSASQLQRLRELTLQSAGRQALLDETVATKVGLTSAKHKELVKLFSTGAKQLSSLQKEAYDALAPKYKDKKPKNEAEGKRLQEEFQRDLGAELKKRSGRAKQIEQEFDAKLKSLVTKAQWNNLESLRGKPSKPVK